VTVTDRIFVTTIGKYSAAFYNEPAIIYDGEILNAPGYKYF